MLDGAYEAPTHCPYCNLLWVDASLHDGCRDAWVALHTDPSTDLLTAPDPRSTDA